MNKLMKIEGMMCAHCSGRVEKALNALEGVTATVDLAAGTIENQTQNKLYHFVPMPQRLLDMLEAGGLVATLERQVSD